MSTNRDPLENSKPSWSQKSCSPFQQVRTWNQQAKWVMIVRMPDVDDERVAIVADSIQSSSCADVACVASEAAERSFDDARTLPISWHRQSRESLATLITPQKVEKVCSASSTAQKTLGSTMRTVRSGRTDMVS